LGCIEYRLPPLQATRYNKPTHNCCETTQISLQKTGSPGPNGSRSPAVAPLLEADTSVALGAQTDGTVDSNINCALCTVGRMRTGEEWRGRWRCWTARCREPRAATVEGKCVSFQCRMDYVLSNTTVL
jgi:hypothetical protein